jgi:hypothetical protein
MQEEGILASKGKGLAAREYVLQIANPQICELKRFLKSIRSFHKCDNLRFVNPLFFAISGFVTPVFCRLKISANL